MTLRLLATVLAAVAVALTAALGTRTGAATSPAPDIPNGSSHAYVAGFTGSQLDSWPRSYGGASCKSANRGASVSVSGGNLDLRTDGQDNACAVIASPRTYQYGVIEYRVDVPAVQGLIANWPAAWMVTPDVWPADGEIDAFEGNGGHDLATLWYGTPSDPEDDGTCPPAWECGNTYVAPVGPAITTAGWHTVDIVWYAGSLSIYYDGQLYVTFTGSHVPSSPLTIMLDNTEGPDGLRPTGHASDFLVQYVRVWS